MCAPMYMKSEEIMFEGVLKYAREYKSYEGKTPEQIEEESRSISKDTDGYITRITGLVYRCT